MFQLPQFFKDLPGVGKHKAVIGSAIVMLAGLSGLFHALGDTAGILHDMLTSDVGLFDGAAAVGDALKQAWLFGGGLLGLGVRHAQYKATGV